MSKIRQVAGGQEHCSQALRVTFRFSVVEELVCSLSVRWLPSKVCKSKKIDRK